MRLTEDLAVSRSRQSQLQLEASAHQQKVLELQSKLNAALQGSDGQSQRIAGLEAQLEGVCVCVCRLHRSFLDFSQMKSLPTVLHWIFIDTAAQVMKRYCAGCGLRR